MFLTLGRQIVPYEVVVRILSLYQSHPYLPTELFLCHVSAHDLVTPSHAYRPRFLLKYLRVWGNSYKSLDSHCSFDILGVSLAWDSWRDVASVITNRDKHACTCRSHGFDFIPFEFSNSGSLGEAVIFVSLLAPTFRLRIGRFMIGYFVVFPSYLCVVEDVLTIIRLSDFFT